VDEFLSQIAFNIVDITWPQFCVLLVRLIILGFIALAFYVLKKNVDYIFHE
jgi:hypothetical protein